ncbi:MAG: hypothetical protein OEW95_11945 [Candidatus Bathyarchaeota archaeon]|nr:hypothetical protein [Candidatus Bathyarchaeota archaeon]
MEDFGLINFGLPVIVSFIFVFTLYMLSYVYSPLRQLFHVFSKFSDQHPLIAKTVFSIILIGIWLCFIDACYTLSVHGLFWVAIFLAIFLVIPSAGLLDFIFEEWSFLGMAIGVIAAWFLIYIAYNALSGWIYWGW